MCAPLRARSRARPFYPYFAPPARAVPFDEAQNIAQRAGFTPEDFARFLEDYESLNVIQVNASRTRIDLATSGL